MNNELELYLSQLELIAFFAGYPLIYILIHFISKQQYKGSFFSANKIVNLLPLSYALAGTLFLGFELRNLYPGFQVENIANPYFKIWGALAILFWIPPIYKKPIYSLLHSLIFFLLFTITLFSHLFLFEGKGKDLIQNDIKIYSFSLLLFIITLSVIATLKLGLKYIFRKKILH